jgi:CRP/FNR family cyclic AMP-dependent transcriptional regulator
MVRTLGLMILGQELEKLRNCGRGHGQGKPRSTPALRRGIELRGKSSNTREVAPQCQAKMSPKRSGSPGASLSFGERVRPFLRSNTFFGGLPDGALDQLIARGHSKKFSRGEAICRRGEPGDNLMVLLTGRAKVVNITADAREVVLNFLGPGDLNGEIAVLDGKGRTADTIALEPCEFFSVDARVLLPTLAAHPAALLEVIQALCDKLRSASAIIEDNTLEMRGRTAKGLLRLAEQHGRTSKAGVRLQLSMSQRELGAYLSLSRENVSRQLGRLRDLGVIAVDGAYITITNEIGLEAIAATPSAD